MSPWLSEMVLKLRARWRTLVRPLPVFVAGQSIEDARAAFDTWARMHAGSVCDIGLAGAWVHTCVVPPEVAHACAFDEVALRDYARVQFEHYFGAGDGWVFASARDPRATLVCAIPVALRDALFAVAAAHRVRVQRMAPWWGRAVQRVLREAEAECVVAAVEPGRATLVVAQGGRITRVLGEPAVTLSAWRERLVFHDQAENDLAAAPLWAITLGEGEHQRQVLRGHTAPEQVLGRIGAQV